MIDFLTNPVFYVPLSIITFLFCVSTLIIGGISILALSVNAQTVNVWKDFSEKHGLTYRSPSMPLQGWQGELKGIFEGHQVRISSNKTSRRSEITSKIETSVSNPKEFFLSMGTKGIYGNFYRTTAGQSFIIGRGLDDRFSAQSNLPETAKAFLFTNIDLAKELYILNPIELLIKEQSISIAARGALTDEAAILRLLRATIAAAEVFEKLE